MVPFFGIFEGRGFFEKDGSLRTLIPKAICKQLEIKEGDTLEIWLNKDNIICMRKASETKR